MLMESVVLMEVPDSLVQLDQLERQDLLVPTVILVSLVLAVEWAPLDTRATLDLQATLVIRETRRHSLVASLQIWTQPLNRPSNNRENFAWRPLRSVK